jgi:drug/metabolite transporter (DMT)-like permease
MTLPAASRPDPAGLLLLFGAVIGWGLNWPAMKLVVAEVPPLSMRLVGWVIGTALLAALAHRAGERLGVPRRAWASLLLASLLNVTSWMGLAGFSLLWLAAGEATIVCYTMPVWAVIAARLVLGEAISQRRLGALALALGALGVLLLGQGVGVGLAKLPGVAVGLGAAVLFSLGTVIGKRWPLGLPPTAGAAWQIGLGCAPLLPLALVFEHADWGAVSPLTWGLMIYGGVLPLGLSYLFWFAALRRLSASVAAMGTLLTPVVGVLGGAALLGEPLGPRELVALSLAVGGVVLAIRG